MPLPPSIRVPAQSEDIETLLKAANDGKKADLDKAKYIAENIRNPAYGLRAFHDDLLVAFPELNLYMIENSTVSSNVTPDMECALPPSGFSLALSRALSLRPLNSRRACRRSVASQTSGPSARRSHSTG